MAATATTKMSSKGQVVIPDKIREHLHLKSGTEFVVVSSGDAVILKPIIMPVAKDFEALLQKASRAAKKAGIKKSDVAEAIREVRKSK